MHFCKMISTFYKNHLDKSTATLPLIDFAPSIAKLTIKLANKPTNIAKRKRSRLTKVFVKQTREI